MNRTKSIVLSALCVTGVLNLSAMEIDEDAGYTSSDSCAAHKKGTAGRLQLGEDQFDEAMADYDIDTDNPSIEFCDKKPREVTVNGKTYLLATAPIVSKFLILTPESIAKPSSTSASTVTPATYVSPAYPSYPSAPTAYPEYSYFIPYNPYAVIPPFGPYTYARTALAQAAEPLEKPLTRIGAAASGSHPGEHPYDLHKLDDHCYALVCYLSKGHPRRGDLAFGRGYNITFYKK